MEPLADRQDMLDRLVLAEHDLGVILADGAVMIDLGKTEILDGEVTEPDERGSRRDSASAQVFEEGFENGAVHAADATGSRYW